TYFKATKEDPHHIFSWNQITLENFLRQHFTHVKVFGNQLRLQKSRSKWQTLKILILSRFVGADEIIAVCSK
ncbi:hypothetical protein J7L49_00850, partial [Candidatus Bathyarchaeota archaeon]|nr:hypothetical protein [Candidatus Bathyarchaeota archaeon]